MKLAIYPGSFDPVTYGHIDLITRASRIFDHIIVAVLVNPAKTPLFTAEERVTMLREVTANLSNVEIDFFSGLLVDYAREKDCHIAIRGLRAMTDFDYELHFAQTNATISKGDLETVFLSTDVAYSFLSSSTVREIASFHGDVSGLVPRLVAQKLYKKYGFEN